MVSSFLGDGDADGRGASEAEKRERERERENDRLCAKPWVCRFLHVWNTDDSAKFD